MKKAISVLLSLIMILSLITVAFAADTEEKLNYLLLGDSIARGSGILNHDEACYGRIVANTNGYNYKNDAVNGFTAAKLDNYLNKSSIKNDVADADIISISIGGNDFIKSSSYIPAILSIAFGSTGLVDNIIDKFYPSFCSAIEKIKKINPDAVILVQTLYNPRMIILKQAFGNGLERLNAKYYQYLEENPGAYEIVDVYSYLSSYSGYVAIDTIHPNGYGNKLIAKSVLLKLNELGLGDNTEPVIETQPVDEIAIPVYWIFKNFAA